MTTEMSRDTIKILAKSIILDEFAKRDIHVKDLLLFGSQARGDNNPDSDWDFFVIIGQEIQHSDKVAIVAEIQRKLAKHSLFVDIVVKSETSVNTERKNVGFITYYALKDGIAV